MDSFADRLNQAFPVETFSNTIRGLREGVAAADEAVKGNTVSGAKKTVLLETGIKITVPLFIKTGDIISIDPESGEYVERVND